MHLALGFWACLCLALGRPSGALILRCGLSACLRFSPRAALALSGLAALFACAGGLCARALRAQPCSLRPAQPMLAFLGGALGRAAVLMLDALLPSSLSLLRVQAVPLALMALCAMRVPPPRADASPRAAAALAFFLAALDGFFGTDASLLLPMLIRRNIVRRRRGAPSTSLLACACAQLGALLLTLLSGASLVFPARMLTALAAGAVLGALLGERSKGRGSLPAAPLVVMNIYGLLAALACVGHALFPLP